MRVVDPGQHLNVHTIDYSGSVSDGPGVRTVLFLQGCVRRCKGCHNPGTWPTDSGTKVSIVDLIVQLRDSVPNKKLTISGGEPLLQSAGVLELLRGLPDFSVVLYTGSNLMMCSEMLQYLDYLKVGPYEATLRCTTTSYIGSSNQQFLPGPRKKRLKGIQFDNAAQRKTYVGYVYEAGTKAVKQEVLRSLPATFSELHNEGKIHIHDLEAYGQTYNCLQVDIQRGFPIERFLEYSIFRRISGIFDYFREVVVKLGNEQSGGIGFPNFDLDVELLLDRLGVVQGTDTLQILKDSLEAFIDWANSARDRCGQTTFYVSLNLGLATGSIGRFITRTVLQYFRDASIQVIKPNIIFKVVDGTNGQPEDANYDLFLLALECTCHKMIPTYLLFDSQPNSTYDPEKIAIMGCRTRVVSNILVMTGPLAEEICITSLLIFRE